MDERHWWIATKIQESFHIGGFHDNPTLLEDFLCEPKTLELINQFLGTGGPNKLFFYSDRPQTSSLFPSGLQSTRQLHVVSSLAALKEVNIEDTTCLYFLRHHVNHDVDPVHMEKDIFCGELRHSVLDNLNTLLSDIYLPLLRAQKDWGQCSEENVSQCLNSLEKYAGALAETVNVPASGRQQVLRRPDNMVSQEFSKHRTTSYDHSIITEYEALVTEWISTIDNALADGGDERFMDPTSGPMSELERWRRRQRMLSNIMEQLKGKECKTVIGVLITSKSKVLKKWKAIDASITDAANETKDKVKYLEALRRHFEHLYHSASPADIINTALPGLANNVKQMDSISRFYARSGYLGLLFTKITNQLVNACKEYITAETITPSQEDLLWPKFYTEIEGRVHSTDQQGRSRAGRRKGKDQKADPEDDTLLGRLKACLKLYSVYRDTVRTLRDNLGGAHTLMQFPSISSLGAPTSRVRAHSRGALTLMGKASKTPSVAGDSDHGHGVPFTDEESIFGHMESFCARLRQVIDAIYTLVQYSKLGLSTEGLPRPRKEDLVVDDDATEDGAELAALGGGGGGTNPSEHSSTPTLESPVKPVSPTKTPYPHAPGILPVVEEEENLSGDEEEEEHGTKEGGKEENTEDPMESEVPSNADEVHDLIHGSTGITAHNAALLRKLYSTDNADDEGPSISSIVKDHIATMKKLLSSHVDTAVMLDVEGKEKEKFGETYEEFLGTVQQIEMYLCAYLQAVFLRRMKTHEALDVITRFTPVAYRQGMKRAIAEKYVDIFNWYEADLEEVKNIYEKYKEEPPMIRNAPPVAGAISWSRQLLQRIEDPMKVFRDNRAVTHLRDFSRVVRFYNRVATALVTFESLWLAQWRAHIDNAKAGLRATLLISHPETGQVVVNADEGVLQLIHECRWLKRLGIDIPDSAQMVLKQEQRFKSYFNHLELCLKEFHDIVASIRDPIRSLFKPHINSVTVTLQPGLTTLAWNSMNIDAFLHQVHTANAKLKHKVDTVNHVIDTKVDAKLKKISELFLFDTDLAFSRSWPPEEFTQAMLDSVGDRSAQLHDLATEIEEAVHELINILLGRAASPSHHSPRQSLSASSRRHSGKQAVNLTPRTEASSGDTGDDIVISDILYHYSELVYQAVTSSICRTLITLAEAAGCEGIIEAISRELAGSSSPLPPDGRLDDPHLPSTPGRSRSRPSTGRSGMSGGRHSRASTALSRATSSLSFLSDMSWTSEKTHEITYLRFEVAVKFSIPNIIISPTLDAVKTALARIAEVVLNTADKICWWAGGDIGEPFLTEVVQEPAIESTMRKLDGVVEDLQRVVDKHLFHFKFYDFLWKDDMYAAYYEFIDSDPGTFAVKREVERLLHIEEKIRAVPAVLPVGSVCLGTAPITDALYGFAVQWKTQYAQVLHEEAKRRLDQAVMYRNGMRARLTAEVVTLDQLNGTLNWLEEVRDMENKVDKIYLPIETMYADLRSYKLRLPRSEVEEVEQLRDKWQEVIDLAEQCRVKLLRERRGAFEQELDKQVKLFVVEVIQFRNSFDSQGPAVPGVQPAEAVSRLHEFQEIFKLYDSKRRTLDSVSRLFGIICKPFPELDKTGEELDLLGLLYGLFQKFIAFDSQFRDKLWADVDLEKANREVENYWEECQNLPDKLKDWDAYNEMKSSIKFYLDVFPILHKLASKEIRNRHWLQVMSVTGSSFQLEANVFKLLHILDIGLIEHQAEIEDICRCASKEQELEVKLRITEEEWTEQVLSFEEYKKRGPIYLEKDNSEHLLEQLENAQALLANMLTSRYIGPLREEAAGWAEKLKGVAEVLEQWLEVQDLWQYLEAVFSVGRTAKDLPQEAKRFNRIDKSWTKIMKRAYDTRNVLQCTYGGEVPKGVVLRHIYEELEICFKSLMGYLDKKRQAFPRFYFLSDPVLLAILSRPFDLESVRPHLRCIFNSVYDIRLEQLPFSLSHSANSSPEKSYHSARERHHSPLRTESSSQAYAPSSSYQHHSRMTLGESLVGGAGGGIQSEHLLLQAVAVVSKETEVLQLDEEVSLKDSVEIWLHALKESIAKTIYSNVCKMIEDVEAGLPIEELAGKFPMQVAGLGLLMYWTKECELGIMEIRNDRKAVANTAKKFGTTMGRLSAALTRGTWKTLDEGMTPLQRLRLESLIAQSLYLRDTLEHMSNRKLREIGDFEWRRCVRFYHHLTAGRVDPQIYMLDERFTYGSEFYGGQASLVLTPITERCFLTMAQAMRQFKNCAVTGGTGVGKTETAKGFAFMLGQYLSVFGCSGQSDPAGLGKILQGLAMDGCWGCFDEFQLLQTGAIAMVLDHVHAIMAAVRSRSKHCILGDGEEVTLKSGISLFITVNNETAPPEGIPVDIKLLFRTVALVMPDFSLILKARCAAYGFRSPRMLADRLKMVAQQCKEQLTPDEHPVFNIKNMISVLLHAVGQWRDVEGSKEYHQLFGMSGLSTAVQHAHLGRKLTKEERMELSRASSQGSIVQPGSAMPSAAMLKTVEKQQRKPGVPNPMTPAAKAEHAVVAQALHNVIGPRLKPDALYIFNNVVKDVFTAMGSPPTPQSSRARRNHLNVEHMVVDKAQENGIMPHTNWVNKVMQLYSVSQVNHAIIVAGGPGTGKSSAIQTLVEALSAIAPAHSRQSRSSVVSSSITAISHKLQRLNPLVVDDLALMFGHLNQNRDWVDGVFTNIWRKANRNVSTTWLCLDGPLTPSWADNFNSVLDNDKVLHLHNGDRLFLSDNVKLVFETGDLTIASPATVTRAGIVYLDKDVLGWRPIAQAWMENRNQQEVHCLQKAFNKTMDAVVNFVLYETRPLVPVCEVGLFKMCLGLLTAMLNEHVEIGGELHIERLFLFCLIWSFGGLLEGSDRKNFSDLLRTLTSALPDYDHDISVFDYYVDESGEWDPWLSRVPEVTYTSDTHDLLGEIFVETVDTIRCRVILEFANLSNMHVLLVGPPGSGKTAMINDFINTLDPSYQVTKRLVFSGASTASQLQQFIVTNIHHRRGFVYGARDNKRLQLFIDDLNLPPADEHGVQRCNELLRQLLDDRVLVTLQKPFEWRTIQDLVVLSGHTRNVYPSVGNKKMPQRLLRHFAVVSLPEPHDSTLTGIVDAILDGNMHKNNGQSLAQELHEAIVTASCQLLTKVQAVLRPSLMPGRHHYMFTLRDLTKAFQCLVRLSEEARGEISMVTSLWQHEVRRIMQDRLCRTADINWFEQTLADIVKTHFPEIPDGDILYEDFVTFPIEPRTYVRPVTSLSQKSVRVVLQPVEQLDKVHQCVHSHLTRYNEEFGNVTINIMLSDDIIHHVIRIHRVLSFHHGGNLLMVGAIGSHLTTLVNLALHVADMPIHPIDTSRSNNFFDGLRSAVRLAGTEGKMLTLMFTARDLKEEVYLDAINSLLVCGEYPPLFSNDELDGLLQALGPAMKRHFPNTLIDPMKFFVSRVKTNLHIIICVPPTDKLLRIAPSEYPGLVTGMQMNWMCDWSHSALLGEATYFIHKHSLAKDSTAETREKLVSCLANIHSFILHDCNQIPWAGSTSETVQITTLKIHGKKEAIKVQTLDVANLPYTKLIMKERIKLRHRDPKMPGKHELFIGPRTFRRFLDCFRYIYSTKGKENTAKVGQLRKALACLDRTQQDTQAKRRDIKQLQAEYEGASGRVASLLAALTQRATLLEKTKAQFAGEAGNSLTAFLQMHEVESEEETEDELLAAEERDEYDKEFERMRQENLQSRKMAIEEDLELAVKKVAECRGVLQKARDQVIHWREKVDRSCIERLRSFQNPPQIVLQVMEMVMALLGKNRPLGQNPSDRSETKMPNEDASVLSGRHSSLSSPSPKSPTKTHRTPRKTRPAPPKYLGYSSGESVVTKSKSKDQLTDKQKWKQMQNILNDSTKFVEILQGVDWENGLDPNIRMNVEHYLPKPKGDGEGVTGEGSLLEVPGGPKLPASSRRSPSSLESGGITIAAVRYSSEDAGNLVAYICSLVEYSHQCGPLRAALEKQAELEKEKMENERLQKEQDERAGNAEAREALAREEQAEEEEEPVYTEADIPALQQAVTELQKEFDAAVVVKHALESELQASNERLKAATNMIRSLQQELKRWQAYVDDNAINEWLLSTCVSAAAFLTYCGGMDPDSRHRLAEYFNVMCGHHGLPVPKKKLFADVPLIQFLYSQVDIESLRILNLPSTPNSLNNACFILQELSSSAWTLLCDPTSRVIDWLKCYLSGRVLLVKYHELRSQLETCLTEGTPLVIMDCDAKTLAHDQRFTRLLRGRMAFMNAKAPFKMMVADHEVECHPNFRVYLHTTEIPQRIPHSLAAYTSVMNFYQTREDCEEELLDRFMALEKARLDEDGIVANKEKIFNLKRLNELEQQMLDCLASDTRLLNDLATTKKLAELKKHYDETLESQDRVQMSEKAIHNAREGYRSIAKRGAVCFDAARSVVEINPMYQTSWQQFLDVYDSSIKHSERAAVKAVVERLTYNAFQATARSLLERDRMIYALLLAMEVEDSLGNVGPGEREFVISPQLGSSIMTALGHMVAPDHRIAQAKKPFDWMLDEQFHNLQLLAIHYEWFQEMFDRMPKDGRETQWRTLGEHDTPETAVLPEKMDDIYNPMQRLMVLRAFRPDRIMQAGTVFVNAVLGKKYVGEVALDLPGVVKQSTPLTPVLLLYTKEGDLAERMFQEYAAKKQCKAVVVALSNSEQNEERSMRRSIQTAMQEGHWVLLQNAHNSTHVLNTLETVLKESSHKHQIGDTNFRLWISAKMTPTIPVRLLQFAIKVVVDSPRIMKDSLLRSMSLIDTDTLKLSSRGEWPPLLHNLAMLHATIRLRGRFNRAGWNHPHTMDFGFNEISEAIQIAATPFKDYTTLDGESLKGISWIGLRYVITELIYGSHVTDEYDQANLSAMVDYWVGPNAVKREYEATKLRYKIPAAFFSNNVRLTAIMQALESMTNHSLDVPEACNIHTSTETQLGDDQYIYTRLNAILDSMPASRTLSHVLQPRPATPFKGPSVASVNGSTMYPNVAAMGIYASASIAAVHGRKEQELWEICHTMLNKVPRGWNREYVTERVRKTGGDTPFNRFILREIDLMLKLLVDIKTSLQKLKALTEKPTEVFGDQMSETLVSIADDLYHHRIPAHWCDLAGDSMPPINWPLGQFLNDLSLRCQHLERIIIQGRDKFPAYWLGAFFHPKSLLALLRQDAIRSYGNSTSQVEPFVFQTEITARDKDHVRDPPQEGMFVYGIYIWGCTWEKTTGELQDTPPRHGPTPLPIVHVLCMPQSEKPALNDPQKAAETFNCPVYPTRISSREPVFTMDVRHDNVPASKWALRGMAATIRPY